MHHALVQCVQFSSIRLEYRFPFAGKQRVEVVPGCPDFDDDTGLGFAQVIHARVRKVDYLIAVLTEGFEIYAGCLLDRFADDRRNPFQGVIEIDGEKVPYCQFLEVAGFRLG